MTGPVKAGKTKALIEKYEELTSMGEQTQVFSSKFSLNQGETVQSRFGTKLKAIPIDSIFDTLTHIKPDTKNIMIDEFQFLQGSKNDLRIFFTENYGKYEFFVYGLDLDFQKKSFALMAEILCLGDIIIKLHSNCDMCDVQNKGRYSLRLEDGEPAEIYSPNPQIILLDGTHTDTEITYKSICEECWKDIYGK